MWQRRRNFVLTEIGLSLYLVGLLCGLRTELLAWTCYSPEKLTATVFQKDIAMSFKIASKENQIRFRSENLFPISTRRIVSIEKPTSTIIGDYFVSFVQTECRLRCSSSHHQTVRFTSNGKEGQKYFRCWRHRKAVCTTTGDKQGAQTRDTPVVTRRQSQLLSRARDETPPAAALRSVNVVNTDALA